MARGERGLTLLELMVVMLIAGLLLMVAAVSLRAVDTVSARTGARFMASTLRFAYDRARATGKDFRIVFDLDAEGGAQASIEVATEGVQLLPRDLDEAWKEHEAFSSGEEEETQQEAMESTTIGGLSKSILDLPRPTGPHWQPFKLRRKSAAARFKKVARMVRSIYLPRLEAEIKEGKVALYVWGGGRLERAAIYLSDGKGSEYTLVTQPLTGRVRIYEGHKELPSDLVNADEVGDQIEER